MLGLKFENNKRKYNSLNALSATRMLVDRFSGHASPSANNPFVDNRIALRYCVLSYEHFVQ